MGWIDPLELCSQLLDSAIVCRGRAVWLTRLRMVVGLL